MTTVALEFVPPEQEAGVERAQEDARKVRGLLEEHGIADRVTSLLIPGIIEEEEDRPVPLRRRMDPLDTWQAVREILPLECLVTQVTSFHSEAMLADRFRVLRSNDIESAVCVGVPRTMNDGEGSGVAPTDALERFKNEMPSLGVILIPTREGELGRFKFKLDKGADFALCQLLYSDYIVQFLQDMAKETDHRPQILLSFGFVPKLESRIGLIRWLIQDDNPLVKKELEFVAELAEMPARQKRAALTDVYKRVIDGVEGLGFPLGLHLECPYGYTNAAFRTFRTLLDTWTPP
jgi:hypothetical protein